MEKSPNVGPLILHAIRFASFIKQSTFWAPSSHLVEKGTLWSDTDHANHQVMKTGWSVETLVTPQA